MNCQNRTFYSFPLFIPIHSKKNGSNVLNPSKINGFKHLT